MKSIMQEKSDRSCFICGAEYSYMEEHHVFEGTANRRQSELYGLKVTLCPECHRLSRDSVHMDPRGEKAITLKKKAQFAFEKEYSHIDFRTIFGFNMLDDEDRQAFLEEEKPKSEEFGFKFI